MSAMHGADAATESLWRNAAFLRLWFARAVSAAGSAITGLALPLTAIYVLGAGPGQMALLRFADFIPNILFGLFIGVWIDRVRRLPILVWSDLGRGVLLASIPLAAFLGFVTFPHLLVVAFIVSILFACSTLAELAIVPSVVPRKQLVEANSRLATTDAALAIVAPTVAGSLIQLVGAAKAILADALASLGSVLIWRSLPAREERPEARAARGTIWGEMAAGMRELVRTPENRALTISICVGTFGTAMSSVVNILFVVRELGFSPALIGLLGAAGGAGGLIGSACAGVLSRRFGIGPAIILGSALWAAGTLVAPLTPLGPWLVPLVAAGSVVANLGGALWGVGQMSVRQAIIPAHLFARATAARRLPIYTTQLAGAALGGVLGTAIGLRATLFLGALGLVAAALILWASPIRALREMPASGEAG